jgi:hypothetical protein
MDGPRGQHTVPKSYLRKFVNRRNQLFAFDKKELRSFPASLNSIAKERDFYDLSPEVVKATGLTSKLIEGGYSRLVDGTLMQDVHSFLKCSPMQLTDWDARVHVVQFITFQYLRTRTALNHAAEITQKLTDQLVDDLMKKNFTEAEQELKPKVVINETEINMMLSMIAFDIEATLPVVSAIAARKWILGVNRTDIAPYTSGGIVKFRGWKESGGSGLLDAVHEDGAGDHLLDQRRSV